jgi:hypothetical protein
MGLPFRITAPLLGLLLPLLLIGQPAQAQVAVYDPPARVARLSFLQGDVSFSPAGEPDWVVAGLNRPLIRGDRLWTDIRGRVELELGNAAFRADEFTALTLLDLDDEVAQVELTEGRLNLFVRQLHPGQVYEIATPTLALVITEPGSYMVEVGRDGRFTEVQVWRGSADAYGDRAHLVLRQGDAVRFHDPWMRDFQFLALRTDDFTRFSFARDERMQYAQSLRYVSSDVIGYSDLDQYGSWRQVRDYGAVWFPSQVRADWAPYRYGHWIWQEPWGWTWVDDTPWGFAPFHYGRWAYVGNRWGWIPTPPRTRAVYAPALVAFVGGAGWTVGVNLRSEPIGWFPLGPRDVYVPSYRVSRGYFTRINHGPTFISTTHVVNVYNNHYVRDRGLGQLSYTYRSLPGAVTVVPSDVFVRSQPVSRALLRVDSEAITRAEVHRLATHAPSRRSVLGPAQSASAQPRREAVQREVRVRREPPPEIAPFAQRQAALQRAPGRPLAEDHLRGLRDPDEVRAVGPRRSQVRVLDTDDMRTIDPASVRPDRQALQVPRTRPERDRPTAAAAAERDASAAMPRLQREDVPRGVDPATAAQRSRPSVDPAASRDPMGRAPRAPAQAPDATAQRFDEQPAAVMQHRRGPPLQQPPTALEPPRPTERAAGDPARATPPRATERIPSQTVDRADDPRARGQAAREQAGRERAARDQAVRERDMREQDLREQAAREQSLREQAARERATVERVPPRSVQQAVPDDPRARGQAAREHVARERAGRDQAVQAAPARATVDTPPPPSATPQRGPDRLRQPQQRQADAEDAAAAAEAAAETNARRGERRGRDDGPRHGRGDRGD